MYDTREVATRIHSIINETAAVDIANPGNQFRFFIDRNSRDLKVYLNIISNPAAIDIAIIPGLQDILVLNYQDEVINLTIDTICSMLLERSPALFERVKTKHEQQLELLQQAVQLEQEATVASYGPEFLDIYHAYGVMQKQFVALNTAIDRLNTTRRTVERKAMSGKRNLEKDFIQQARREAIDVAKKAIQVASVFTTMETSAIKEENPICDLCGSDENTWLRNMDEYGHVCDTCWSEAREDLQHVKGRTGGLRV